MRKLEIGSGNRPLPDYEHLDINPSSPHVEIVASFDAIPVKDDTYDEIQAIHIIEHYPWGGALKVLSECLRILKPKGKIRIATPSLKFIAKTYLDAINGNRENMIRDVSLMLPEEIKDLIIDKKIDPTLWANFKIFSSGHLWDQHFACYDSNLLSLLLKQAGCVSVTVVSETDSLVVEGYK